MSWGEFLSDVNVTVNNHLMRGKGPLDVASYLRPTVFPGDDFWYRAIVLAASETEVKVMYADYGNVETLPPCRVQPISASHLQLPFQIIKCSFEGRQCGLFPVWLSLGCFFVFVFSCLFYSSKSKSKGYFKYNCPDF